MSSLSRHLPDSDSCPGEGRQARWPFPPHLSEAASSSQRPSDRGSWQDSLEEEGEEGEEGWRRQTLWAGVPTLGWRGESLAEEGTPEQEESLAGVGREVEGQSVTDTHRKALRHTGSSSMNFHHLDQDPDHF